MGGDTIFHSDRGSTYASGRYRQACIDLGLRQSAGRTGSCLDNAGAESFFATLIQELGRRHFATRADAGYRPPVEYEQQLTVNQRHVGSRQAA